MSDRKTILVLIAIVAVVLILIAILIGIYSTPKKQEENQMVQNNLYFVTKNAETGYGVCKTDGSAVLESKFNKIARVNDSIYLKNDTDSYIFFLNDGKNVSLGGKESEIYFVYSKEGSLLPYYILRYGESEQTSIYRIFNDKGVRHVTKDFATLNDAYKYLNAKEVFKSATPSEIVTNLYTVISTLNYPTSEGKTQYIVTKKNDTNGPSGIVDESGRILLELSYKKISAIANSTNAVEAVKDDKTYIFMSNEKLIEVESGFEFITENGYIIQKRGNIVNKIYNSIGDVVVDGIYNLTEDLTPFTSKNGTSYVLVQEKKDIFYLYNLTTNTKNSNQYTGVILTYIPDYKGAGKNTTFMYKKGSDFYSVELESLKEYKMKITSEIVSPLDMGIIYNFR